MNIADINAEARDLVDATSTSLSDATLLRHVNADYETVVGWLINADGQWQFDDSNYTTLPIGLATLVDGQTSYSFTSTFLDIEQVNVLTSAGSYQKVLPVDHNEFGDLSIEEYMGILTSNTPKGMPIWYDKWEDTIKLYPAPDPTSVTLADGLKVYFKRTADLFTSAQVTTGTKEPGFASPWHHILAYMAARRYAQKYKKDRVSDFDEIIGDKTPRPTGMKKELLRHYGLRDKDKRRIVTPRPVDLGVGRGRANRFRRWR